MDSNKRLKSASGAPITTSNPAANLTAYQPPTPAAIAGVGGVQRPATSRPTASITRGANGSSLKLKVKAPSSKLKQVTGASDGPIPPNPYADLSESDATPQPARTARQTRNPRTVVEPDSDEEMDDAEGEEQDEDEGMEDEEGEGEGEGEDEEDEEEASEEDAEGEDDDEDELASDPPPPVIRQERPPGKSKPNVTVTAPPEGPVRSVEDKEMEDEDEELSELDSNQGRDEDDEEEEEEEEDDSDEDIDNSRSATPDLTKLTKRQRGAITEAEDTSGGLMELSNEAQKKKHLTAEEQVMRRAEMARRRKNLSEKRNEEEKMDTINKLLKKPAPKRRTRAEILAQQQADMMATPGAEDGEEERPDPLFVRWVNGAKGSRMGVPEEWMESAVGEVFRDGNNGMGGGRLVEEIS